MRKVAEATLLKQMGLVTVPRRLTVLFQDDGVAEEGKRYIVRETYPISETEDRVSKFSIAMVLFGERISQLTRDGYFYPEEDK